MTTPVAAPLSPADERRLLLAGIVALALAMGVGRFLYTPMLPLMLRGHALDAAGGGWLATVNFVGYLAGALYAALGVPAARRTAAVATALAATVATTAGMGLSDSYAVWAVLRFIAGVATALAMVLGGALVLERLPAARRAAGSGYLYGGIGAGMAMTTLAVGVLDRLGLGTAGVWVLSGLACALLLPLCRPLLRPAPAATAIARTACEAKPVRLGWLVAAYGLAGFGYSVSATFLPVIVRSLGLPALVAESCWFVAGLAAIPASLVWGALARRRGTEFALGAALATETAGVALPLLLPNAFGALAGGALFGASFLAVVGLALAVAREAEPARASRAMGLMTASFGLGQILAPALSSALIGAGAGFGLPLALAAGALLAGLAMLTRLHPHPAPAPRLEPAP